MVGRTITATELRERLLRSGHYSEGLPNGVAAGPDLWSPDTIVTIALGLDPTLRRPYRERYFACLLESEANPVAILQFDPEFALPGPFETIAAEQPVAEGFMTGPFRWLLSRLSRHHHLLLWPSRRAQESGNSEYASGECLNDCPRLRDWLRVAVPSGSEVGAIVLDMANKPDCQLLWEVANNVAQSFHDFYVGDLQCAEVYQMHHHDKVVVSIPDFAARQALLREAIDRSDVLEECSGYSSPMDDDGE
jgi:hypothetical protein